MTARARVRQVVALSGSTSSKLAAPSSSVVSSPIQSAVCWKFDRNRGAGPPPSSPPGGAGAGAATAWDRAAPLSAEKPDSEASARSLAESPVASPSPRSPSAESWNGSLRRSTETASDEAVCTPSGRSYQNASIPLAPRSYASESTASSTMATATSAATPAPSASVTSTS